jgi:hypothetical protein
MKTVSIVYHVMQANFLKMQDLQHVQIAKPASPHQKVHQHATNVPRASSEQLTVQMHVRNVLQVSMRMLLD